MAFFVDVLLASQAILPFLVGTGTRDEALRKSAWEARVIVEGKPRGFSEHCLMEAIISRSRTSATSVTFHEQFQ